MESSPSVNVSLNSTEWDKYQSVDYTSIFKIQHAYAILGLVLAPVTIIANVVLIVTIVTDKILRTDFRHLVMVSVSAADLLIGLFVCTVRGHVELTNTFLHHCVILTLLFTIEEYVQMFVGTWGIVTINFDYILTLFSVKLAHLSPWKRKLLVAVIIALPWLAMFFLVLPVAYAHAKSETLFRYCYLHLQVEAERIVSSFTYFIPSFIIICQSIVMITYHFCHQQRNSRMPSIMTSSDDVMPPWVFIVAGVVTVGLVGFEQCGHMARDLLNKLPPLVTYSFYFSATFISDTKSAVIPLVWFALPELRTAFMVLINKLPWRRVGNEEGNIDDTIITYKNLCDDSEQKY